VGFFIFVLMCVVCECVVCVFIFVCVCVVCV